MGGRMIAVNIPKNAEPSQVIMVPVPVDPNGECTYAASDGPAATEVRANGKSTGAKVAMGIGGAVVVGGIAVGVGYISGYAFQHGIEAIGDMLTDASAGIEDAVVDFGESAADFFEGPTDAA